MSFSRYFLLCCLCGLSQLYAQQQTYFVSPDGDNANDGTSLESSWQTITHGLATIAPGDTLLVADGLYVETDLLIDQVSTPDQPTVVKSINTWGAKIEGNKQYSTILRTEGARHVVIDGFEVYNPEQRPLRDWNTGINIFRSNFVTVQNCYVRDCGCGGIGGRESDYMTIRRNVTRGNAKTNPYNCSGISIYQPTQLDDEPGTHILISENVTFENECRLPFSPLGFDVPTDGNGIILDDFNWTQSIDGGPQEDPFVAETIVENNLSFNNGGAGMKAYEVANAIFRNNTSVHNNHVLQEFWDNGAEIAGQAVSGNVAFYNNVAVQAFGRNANAMYWSPLTPEATLQVHNNIIVGDLNWRRAPTEMGDNQTTNYDEQSYPRFARILPEDFTFSSVDDFRQYFGLREGSPGLGAGEASLAPEIDLNGNIRPATGSVDAGAYEGVVAGVGPVAADRVFEGEIPSTAFTVDVNGIKDPFYSAAPLPLTRIISGQVANTADLSASWTATWDETNLYLFIEVVDNRLRNDSADPSEDDGVEIFIDADNSRGATYDGVNDFHYILGWNDTEIIERSGNATEGVVSAQSSGFTGYTKEVAIPWATLGITPDEDLLFGLDFWVNDDDNEGTADGRLSWQDRENEAPVNPQTFGSGRLSIAPVPPPIKATPLNGSVTVDGQLDEVWNEITPQLIEQLIDGEVDSPEDLSANWRATWNDNFLYFFVSVTDDVQRANSSDWFNDDAVEFYLDMRLDRSREYDANDYQLSITWNSTNLVARQGGLGQGVLAFINNTTTGYDVEVRLPWSVLGFTPAEGKFFGFDLQITDDDNVGGRDGKIAWFAEVNESDEDPSLFGMVYLAAAPNAVFDPAVARPLAFYPNPTSGEVVLDLTEVPTYVSVLDLQGRELLRATQTKTVNLSSLPTGNYLLSAQTQDGVYRAMLVKQ